MKKVLLSLLLLASCSTHKPQTNAFLFEVPQIDVPTRVDLTDLKRFKLANGLEVISVPRRSVPSVQVTLVVKAGENLDPLGKSGLAAFASEMLTKGTKGRTAEALAEEIDFIGASLSATSSAEWTALSCHARSGDFQTCLRLLADIVQNPTFPASEMALVREQLEGAIRQVKDSPQSLAEEHAANVYYGNNDIRGLPMTTATLGRIKRADLVEFHRRWFSPSNSILAVSGDFDLNQISSVFSTWRKHAVPLPNTQFLKHGQALRIRIVDKPDATQSTIRILGPGIAHRHPDYFATMLMNYALGGGGFSSRLMQVVRSEGGKTYTANSSFLFARYEGVFSAGTFTRTSETATTLKLVLDEIEKMKALGPTEKELAAAKGNIVGGYGLALETGDDLANRLLLCALHDLDTEHVSQFPAHMQAVTLEQAKKAAADHLAPMAIVVVGKASDVAGLLTEAGYTDFETVSYLTPIDR